MSSPIVFFDIAGPDDKELRQFYTRVFSWNFSQQSQVRIAVKTPLGVAIRKDPAEKRIYIGVDDIKETLNQIEANGGSVDVPRFEVSGVVVLGLFKDPAGNEMGLVEIENGVPKVP
jgi:predicted enzyme related to lactoylglutathione lyase